MRRINFDEYFERNHPKALRIALQIREGRERRPAFRRPLSREDSENMIRFNRRRWKFWIEKGWLIEIGERRYRLKI